MLTLRQAPRAASRAGAPATSAPLAASGRAAYATEPSSARILLGTAEAHLGQAAEGLREAARLARRGEQAQQLARLGQALEPQAFQLLRLAQGMTVEPQDPLHALVRQRLATSAHVQTLLNAGAAFLRAHAAGQGTGEVPALESDWRRRLCEDAQALLHRLAASPHPQDQALAGLALACTPGAVLRELGLEDLPISVHRQAAQWRVRQGPEGLSATHWLALRLFAHPDSGAAAALRAQEHLVHLDPDMAEACGPLLRDLARQHVVSVASAARLPGLGLADPDARYRLALAAEELPHLDPVLREGGEWLVGRPLPACREPEGAGGGPGEGERLPGQQPCRLSLQSRSAQAGPVRGLRMDLFHPPQDLARTRMQVLLMPGQVFRVGEDGQEEVPADGLCLRIRRYVLDKMGEETRHPVPGTLSPGAVPAWEPWRLAGAL